MKPFWWFFVALGGCVSDVDALKGQWEIDTDRLTFNAPVFGEERRSVDVRNRSGAILRLTVHEPVLVGDCHGLP